MVVGEVRRDEWWYGLLFDDWERLLSVGGDLRKLTGERLS
jgi:hypothetical protein